MGVPLVIETHDDVIGEDAMEGPQIPRLGGPTTLQVGASLFKPDLLHEVMLMCAMILLPQTNPHCSPTPSCRLTVYNGVNMQLLTDSGCICGLKMIGGRVGVFSFNQDNVIWTNLQTRCNADQQMKC